MKPVIQALSLSLWVAGVLSAHRTFSRLALLPLVFPTCTNDAFCLLLNVR